MSASLFRQGTKVVTGPSKVCKKVVKAFLSPASDPGLAENPLRPRMPSRKRTWTTAKDFIRPADFLERPFAWRLGLC